MPHLSGHSLFAHFFSLFVESASVVNVLADCDVFTDKSANNGTYYICSLIEDHTLLLNEFIHMKVGRAHTLNEVFREAAKNVHRRH